MYKKLWVILSFIYLPVILLASSKEEVSGFDFLRWEIGTRPASMGGAFIAVIGDLNGLTYNPATLSGARNMEVNFTYLSYLLDIKSGFVGFNRAIKNSGQLGIGIFYTNYGKFERTDVTGNFLGSFSPGDYVITAAYANSLPAGIRYGISVKFIQSRIDQYTAGAIAADAGIIYRIEKQNLNIGFVVKNFGKTVSKFMRVYEKLPVSYRAGIAKQLAHLPLLLNFNLIKYQYNRSPNLGGFYWALGGEFTVTSNFFLRWGYNSRGKEEKIETGSNHFAGVSLGLGIKYGKYCFDYGYSSYGILGGMNYFTVAIPFF